MVVAFIEVNPPDSLPTDISLSQYLAIQEKGVSAWEFEPELEIANCFVEARTEIEFFDSECCVLSNLPVPKQNEVYYWESKIYDKPETTMLSIGMCTKPYPLFRLPGMCTILMDNMQSTNNSYRLSQILRRIYITGKPSLQPTVYPNAIRPIIHPRRRYWLRLPSSNRHRLLHSQRQETRRRRPRTQISKSLPSCRGKRTLLCACQFRTERIRVYRSECEEMGIGTNDGQSRTATTVRVRTRQHTP